MSTSSRRLGKEGQQAKAPEPKPQTPKPDPQQLLQDPVQPPDRKQEPTMVDTKELRINPPQPFDGNRENLSSFLQDCRVYIILNIGIYDTDEKQICYVLSFLTSGTAKAWKEAFVADVFKHDPPNFGTWIGFLSKLQAAFSSADTEGEARAQLRQLKQGKGSTDEYISQFRIFAGDMV
jgi:Retrotransposon gag protein